MYLIDWLKEWYYGPPPPPCYPGDAICEWTGGKYKLPEMLKGLADLNHLITQKTGIPLDYVAPVIFTLAGIIGVGKLYKRYNAKTPQELIQRIIEVEFGEQFMPLGKLLFDAVSRSIDHATDTAFNEMASKSPAIFGKMASQDKEKIKAQIREQKVAELPAKLKEKKDEIVQAATAQNQSAPSTASTSSTPIKASAMKIPSKASEALVMQMSTLLFASNTATKLKAK